MAQEFPILSDDHGKIHRWTEEERVCPVTFGKKEGAHKHFMKCSVCGIRRHGAYAEQGCWHYFAYDHGATQSEVVPPCKEVPADMEVVDVHECSHCRHIIEEPEKGCGSGCNAGQLTLKGLRLKKDFYPREPQTAKRVAEADWAQSAPFGCCPACGSVGIEETIMSDEQEMCFFCPDEHCRDPRGRRTVWGQAKPVGILEREAAGWRWNAEHYPGTKLPPVCPD
ncbi:MAG: hypothetical protein UY99_C0014G0015 [Parcubacteria group bacterium GW2011_GWA1_59_11]|nr:MAG: hypothetical protein UY99_C0014G0015 [Parcubacteria group bacterium GW2011_GWA1_59_11]